jgi:Leucine-rich repeat (LRR) protein
MQYQLELDVITQPVLDLIAKAAEELKTLPESIGKLKLLRELKVTKNQLISLPKSLPQL